MNTTYLRDVMVLLSHLRIINLSQTLLNNYFNVYLNHLRYINTNNIIVNLSLNITSELILSMSQFLNLLSEIELFQFSIMNNYELSENHIHPIMSIPYHIFLDLSDITNPIRITYCFEINEIVLPSYNLNMTLS